MKKKKGLAAYKGQEKIVESLIIAIQASETTGEVMPHVLLYGSAGVGKTELAKRIAESLNSPMLVKSGPLLRIRNDVEEILDFVKITYRAVIFIDEAHGISQKAAELLYSAMQDFEYEGEKLPSFTIIAGTTDAGELPKPFRERFKYIFKLEKYSKENIKVILKNNRRMSDKAADAIATRSFGNPRTAKRYLTLCGDNSVVRGRAKISEEDVEETMKRFGVDSEGLTDTDIIILKYLYEIKAPIGIDSLSRALDINSNNLQELFEDKLIQLGYMVRGRTGRKITERGIKYLQDKNMV